MIDEIRDLIVRTVGEHVLVEFDLAPDLAVITADPGQMQEVIVNLAVNARDAMPNGGRLTIDTATVALDGEPGTTTPNLATGTYVRLRAPTPARA